MNSRRVFVLVCALAFLSCKGRPPSGGPVPSTSGSSGSLSFGAGNVLEFDLSGGLPESMASGGFFQLPATRTYTGLVRAIERASRDGEASGYFVRLGSETGLGWARSEELGRLFAKLRKLGKPVVCHAHGFSNATIWFAARGCDRIWLSPGGDVDSVGIAAQVVYLKNALDKLKINVDVLHMGKFKSAGEPLTRDGPSDEARQSLTETLASIRKTWLDSAAQARKPHDFRASLEQGPWSAGQAKERGLVDAIGFESEARDDAKKRARADKLVTAYGSRAGSDGGLKIAEIIRILSGADERSGGRPHIAVVPAEGAISMQSEGLPFDSGGITHKALSKTLRKLAKDDSVQAVVLRIDSPGGSALASDLIWHELNELRKKKTVVTSVGSMAASGGYYLACGTTRIVAEKTSIIGSIGVVGGKVVIDRALGEFGINTVTFPANPGPGAAERAAYLSPLMPWDAATRARVQEHMQSTYDLFIDRCAKGRKLPADKLRASAEGRIWSGEQGKSRGLIDEFGGLSRALELARELSGLDAEAPITVEGASDSLLEVLMLGDDASAEDVANAAERWQIRERSLLRTSPSWLRPFVGSVAPLLQRETTLAAIPFGLTIE